MQNLEKNNSPEIEKASEQAKKKMFMKTYGCQMNFYDSEKMQEVMGSQGFGISDDMENSDLVIINTCHIREKASEKMYSELGRIRKIKESRKKEGKNTVIAVAGCVAQAEGKFIKQRAPYVDIVVGPQSYSRLPAMVNNAEEGAKKNIDLDFSVVDKFDFLNEEITKQEASKEEVKPTAFVTIQEGCDKFCTFCVVPYTRGAEYSRSVNEIYREVLKLVENGTKEVTLLGQNVNAYHGKTYEGDVWGLGKLIEHLAKIPNLERIRYTTSHPRDCDEDLYSAHKHVEKLMPFIHLPVQSGSDKILKAMNRKHTRDEYFRIIDKFRAARSDIEFSSDFIVGYPNETEADFEDTYDLAEQVKFSLSYSFIYSARPGTPAANLDDEIEKKLKQERLYRLQALLDKQMLEFLENKKDTTQKAHISRKGKFDGQYLGFLPTCQPVIINDYNGNFNDIIDVKVTDVKGRDLVGEVA